jgi:hypothetical protein
MCDICGNAPDADHNQPIHRLHDRISKLEELSDQSVESDQPEEFESLPPRPRCEICGVPNSEPHNQVLHLAEAGGYERVLAPLRAEVVSAAMEWRGWHDYVARQPNLGQTRLREACDKLHETLVSLNGEHGE